MRLIIAKIQKYNDLIKVSHAQEVHIKKATPQRGIAILAKNGVKQLYSPVLAV